MKKMAEFRFKLTEEALKQIEILLENDHLCRSKSAWMRQLIDNELKGYLDENDQEEIHEESEEE